MRVARRYCYISSSSPSSSCQWCPVPPWSRPQTCEGDYRPLHVLPVRGRVHAMDSQSDCTCILMACEKKCLQSHTGLKKVGQVVWSCKTILLTSASGLNGGKKEINLITFKTQRTSSTHRQQTCTHSNKQIHSGMWWPCDTTSDSTEPCLWSLDQQLSLFIPVARSSQHIRANPSSDTCIICKTDIFLFFFSNYISPLSPLLYLNVYFSVVCLLRLSSWQAGKVHLHAAKLYPWDR